MVYVTGPTGAGKTTLLYSMLANLPEIDGLKIVTDQGAEQIDLKIPYGKFFIQMGGWKPPSRWYMRNFSIH